MPKCRNKFYTRTLDMIRLKEKRSVCVRVTKLLENRRALSLTPSKVFSNKDRLAFNHILFFLLHHHQPFWTKMILKVEN